MAAVVFMPTFSGAKSPGGGTEKVSAPAGLMPSFDDSARSLLSSFLPAVFLRFGVGILHSMLKATQFVLYSAGKWSAYAPGPKAVYSCYVHTMALLGTLHRIALSWLKQQCQHFTIASAPEHRTMTGLARATGSLSPKRRVSWEL